MQDEKPLYEVKKDGGQWVVRSTSTGLVQMRSLQRVNCTDWVKANATAYTNTQGTGGPYNG